MGGRAPHGTVVVAVGGWGGAAAFDVNGGGEMVVWWELHGLQSIGVVTGKETDTYLVFWKAMGHGIMMRNEC